MRLSIKPDLQRQTSDIVGEEYILNYFLLLVSHSGYAPKATYQSADHFSQPEVAFTQISLIQIIFVFIPL